MMAQCVYIYRVWEIWLYVQWLKEMATLSMMYECQRDDLKKERLSPLSLCILQCVMMWLNMIYTEKMPVHHSEHCYVFCHYTYSLLLPALYIIMRHHHEKIVCVYSDKDDNALSMYSDNGDNNIVYIISFTRLYHSVIFFTIHCAFIVTVHCHCTFILWCIHSDKDDNAGWLRLEGSLKW